MAATSGRDEKICGKEFPQIISGHPWYLFVDPAVDTEQIDLVVNVLDDDNKFLYSLLINDEP